jgi:hypothetical protein
MALNRAGIEKARKEALEFVAHCELLLVELDNNLSRHRYDDEKKAWVDTAEPPSPADRSWGSKASGALRRKSMDLTRTLADLRRY